MKRMSYADLGTGMREAEEDDAILEEAAEHELAAFHCAVRRQFGAQIARRAADWWMETFEAAVFAALAPLKLRQITILAAARLANEVAGPSPMRVA